MPESYGDLFGMLAGVPNLSGALCKGQAPDFDNDDGDTGVTLLLAQFCEACPALKPCGEWVDSLRPSQRPSGVVAGRYYRPRKPRTSRAKAATEEITNERDTA